MSGADPVIVDARFSEQLRERFPVLDQRVHGRTLAYLDNAASSQQPIDVMDAVRAYQSHDHANVHRGVHTLAARATEAFEGARETVRDWINAEHTSEIVFTRGTTESVNLVASSWGGATLGSGDLVVVTELEHHSNLVPWQLVAQRTGARIEAVPVLEDGSLDQAAYGELLEHGPKLVALGHVSNALGTVNPIAGMIRKAHDAGASVVIDGAQALPHLPVDVRALQADFYAFSGHKMYGPTGIGVLYGRRELLEAMPPWQGGGEMIRTVSIAESTWAAPPHRFEAGTPNISGAVGLAAAIGFLAETGMDRIAARETELTDYATQRLSTIDGLRIVGTAPGKASVISFVVDGVHPHDLGTILDHHGVACRAGHHCAMPLMEALGLPATTRASFAPYNLESEIDALVEGIEEAVRLFR